MIPLPPLQPLILVVDDDADLLHLLGLRLSSAGYAVSLAASGFEALEKFKAERPRVVITDLRMDGMDGHALFEHLQAVAPGIPVIILTAHGSIPEAVAATRRGVYGFLTKPFDGQELLAQVAAALTLSPGVTGVAPDVAWRADIVSVSIVMDELLRQARRLANLEDPLLIEGATGTGKASMARAIWQASPRAAKPFVVVPCISPWVDADAKLSTDTIRWQALLTQAAGGVIYLAEVGDLTPALQAMLLTALRGSGGLFPIAGGVGLVRFIAGTSRDLEREVREGTFRADLYYVLAGNLLRVPSLAERSDDIAALVAHFLRTEGLERCFSPEAMILLQDATWPGNVRQLASVVRRTARMSVTQLIPKNLVSRILGEENEQEMSAFDEARRGFDQKYLENLLAATGGNVTKAARIAERNRTEFYKLLARHQLDPTRYKQR